MGDIFRISCAISIMGLAEFWFVQLTSAVAMNVASQLHNIPIVLGGVLLFGERLHIFAVIGFGVCISGALLYTSERRKTSAEKVSQKEDTELDDFVKNRKGGSAINGSGKNGEHGFAHTNSVSNLNGEGTTPLGSASSYDVEKGRNQLNPITIGVAFSTVSPFE